MKEALKNLVIWTSIPAAIGIAVWVYLKFTGRIDIATTPKTVIALTNAYGSLLLITSLSYGLVRVPKRLWEARDIRLIFGFHCFHVKQYQEDLRDASLDLATQVSVVYHD